MNTKQATREVTVSKSESLVLMKNMMRISISSICYIRDLFPKECFKNKPYGNVEIHQLQGAKKEEDGEIYVTHPNAFLLTQWLEQGVFGALEKEYLSSLIFAIYTCHPVTGQDILLETYEFKTTYQGEGASAKINDVHLCSKDIVKNQAAKFIRSLTEFVGTLDTLPDSCWITLQLKYCDHTPADYEPEYFRASDGEVSSVAERLPLVINIGSLKTPTVDMRLKYAGLESLLFEDLCQVNQIGKNATPRGAANEESIFQGTNCASIEDNLEKLAVTGGTPFSTQVSASTQAHGEPQRELSATERITNFILEGNAVSSKTCAAALAISEQEVKSVFSQLTKDRIIKRKGRGYQIAQVTPAPPVQAQASAPTLAPQPPAPAQQVPQAMLTPVITDAASTAAHSLMAPSAPRKSAAKPTFQQDTSQLTEDIEDSFQDDISTPAGNKAPLAAYHQQPLQLKRGGGGGDEQGVMGGAKAAVEQEVLHTGKENQPPAADTRNCKRGAQVMEALAMSQDSVISATSTSVGKPGAVGAGGTRKRARKCSVIQDPIHLSALHAVARENRQAGPMEQ